MRIWTWAEASHMILFWLLFSNPKLNFLIFLISQKMLQNFDFNLNPPYGFLWVPSEQAKQE